MAKKKKKKTKVPGLRPTDTGTNAEGQAEPIPVVETVEYPNVDLSLSWRWHVATLLIITAIVLGLFGFYKWFIRYWADDRLALAEAYLNHAAQLKEDFLLFEDGYTPYAVQVEQVMVATVEMQHTLVKVQEQVNHTGITEIPPELDTDFASFQTALAKLTTDELNQPPHPVSATLQNELNRSIVQINTVVQHIDALRRGTFSGQLTSELWDLHLELVDLTKQMRYVRGIFDYIAALDMAVEESRRAVGSDNAYPRAFLILGNALEEQGLLEDAGDRYVDVVELDPNGDAAQELIQKYEQQVTAAPEDINAHYVLGRMYRALGDRERALAELRAAIDLDGGGEEPQTLTGYLARRVYREVETGERNEQYPGREG